MKAIVKVSSGPGHVELRDVPDPVPGPGQVKVEVRAAGVCGSDLHIYHDEIKIPIIPPVVMGHEFSGVIVEMGEEIPSDAEPMAATGKWQIGDRVTCETTARSCGRCLPCRLGHYNLCATRQVVGYSMDGCFARYCVVNERQVHRLPDSVSFRAGALTEPLACCVHAVLELVAISPGDLVAITGPGPIGLMCLQLVKAAGGYAMVCGTAGDGDRLERARKLGAEETLELAGPDPAAQLLDLAGSAGVDVFIECAGAPAAARLGLAATRRGGQYVQVGLPARPFELDFSLVAYKELRVTGSIGQHWTSWDRALALMSQGQVDMECLVSHSLPLAEWEQAFRMFEARQGLKIVLEPGHE
jgi:L-iditol 2-dehydrogenase